jgi:monovalent cation/hydrogen antiporter
MDNLQTLILLMFAAAILVGLAQKIRVPYPIALVLGGTFLGFIPRLPTINFDPNQILTIVLPPILYYAAFSISFREFKRNWREIFSLALGLVVVTTIVIAIIFKWLFPQYSWALAFAFGAIVSPPDAVAATTILKRFAIGPRLLNILEGESLINDASAIVLYKLSVAALLSGDFSFSEGGLEFVKVVSGGIIIGFILGILMQRFSFHYLDPVAGVVFSLTTPYITYILADFLGVSGVLAVVVNGLIASQIIPSHHSSLRRILGFVTWDIFVIFLNCFVFILIGLQLRTLTNVMTMEQVILYSGYALLISLVMIVVRMGWVYAKNGISYLRGNEHQDSAHHSHPLNEAALIGWAGMRGIVSLVAALALPFTLPDGVPLEGRNVVIFMTFVVILLTLLIPGFTLSLAIRWLKIHHPFQHQDAHRARKRLVKVAEEKIEHLHISSAISDGEFDFLKTYFILQRHVFEIFTSSQKKFQNLEIARLKVIQAQRKELLEMWKQREIDDKLLSQLEHELDVQETLVVRAEIN